MSRRLQSGRIHDCIAQVLMYYQRFFYIRFTIFRFFLYNFPFPFQFFAPVKRFSRRSLVILIIRFYEACFLVFINSSVAQHPIILRIFIMYPEDDLIQFFFIQFIRAYINHLLFVLPALLQIFLDRKLHRLQLLLCQSYLRLIRRKLRMLLCSGDRRSRYYHSCTEC